VGGMRQGPDGLLYVLTAEIDGALMRASNLLARHPLQELARNRSLLAVALTRPRPASSKARLACDQFDTLEEHLF
jgi:hypothetical protein